MSKRGRSPDILPTAKRQHTGTRTSSSSLRSPLSFDKFLYDELILHIFSHLSWADLCLTQFVSRNWARLAGDNELWRKLYIKEYGRSRLRGSRGFVARQDKREVHPRIDGDQYKDWKWMFRISSNWRRGRCAVDEAGISLFDDVATPHSRSNRSLLILLAGPLTITASSLPSERPSIAVIDHDYQRMTFACEPTQPGLAQIAALALDQSPPRSGHSSLAIVLSTGEIFVFSFNPTDPSSLRQSLHYRPSRHSATTNIIDAAYHHPLLVTLAHPFSLAIFDLSSGSVRHTQSLSTFSCYPPASLVVSSKCATQFKLIITYTIPVYPRHWSVGVTEIRISRSAKKPVPVLIHTGLLSASSFTEDFRSPAYTMAVVSTRTIRAFDVPNGWIDNTALNTMREQWGRKLLNVSSVQTDGKWVVLAPGNELFCPSTYSHGTPPTPSASHVPRSSMSLQLYRLVFPYHSNSVSASPPKLNFVRTLHGHTSPISAVALADGRCISLGENGSIWVWDLEAGSGAEVTSPGNTYVDSAMPSTKGVISFDERRIVSAIAGTVVVRRFDI